MPIGTLSAKIQCQLPTERMNEPIVGPSTDITPTVMAFRPIPREIPEGG